MKKMLIYEPAMCCSTGVCGPKVDKELLRISTVLENLKRKGTVVVRYNLTSAPGEFIKNVEVNQLLTNEGVEVLPVIVVDGVPVMTKRYPSNSELLELLELPEDYLAQGKTTATKVKVTTTRSKGCGCGDGKCC